MTQMRNLDADKMSIILDADKMSIPFSTPTRCQSILSTRRPVTGIVFGEYRQYPLASEEHTCSATGPQIA